MFKEKSERFKAYIAVYLILIKDGRILLLKRANTGYQDGKYSLIAGHLEGGETTKQGIIREAAEEAGIILKPEDLEVVHVMHRYRPDREYFDIYLRAKKWSGEPKNNEPEKCAGLAWFEPEALPENIIPEVKLALENISKQQYYGEHGWK